MTETRTSVEVEEKVAESSFSPLAKEGRGEGDADDVGWVARPTKPDKPKEKVGLASLPQPTNWYRRPRVLVATTVAGLIAILAAVIVIRVATDKGEIVVKSYDPKIEVIIKRNDKQVDGFEVAQRPDGTSYYSGKIEILIKGGTPNGVKIKNGKFTLTRDDTILVEIIRDGKVAVKPDKPSDDPERLAAQWVLRIGGRVGISPDGTNPREIMLIDDLPLTLYRVVYVNLDGNKQVSDVGLAHLAHLSELGDLKIRHTSVSDAGMRQLASLTSLHTLALTNTKVTDTGLKHLSGLTRIHNLFLQETQITDDGLEHLAGMPQLNRLMLEGT
ncbi:MAG: hypothetical protein IH991_07505, partial [Planctomycetes bacterium]|nr:hypothetical protein [Planctomycetota bacterium]